MFGSLFSNMLESLFYSHIDMSGMCHFLNVGQVEGSGGYGAGAGASSEGDRI